MLMKCFRTYQVKREDTIHLNICDTDISVTELLDLMTKSEQDKLIQGITHLGYMVNKDVILTYLSGYADFYYARSRK